MSQEQYDRLLESLDKLLAMGKIDEIEYAERTEKINRFYVQALHQANIIIAQREA